MFNDHECVCVMNNSVLSNTRTQDRNIGHDYEIFIVYDASDVDPVVTEQLQARGKVYELRFISSTDNLDGKCLWDGNIYFRHGKDHHKSWWVQNLHQPFFIQTPDGRYGDLDYKDVDVCVYVIENTQIWRVYVNHL